jgi:hypothetical protein
MKISVDPQTINKGCTLTPAAGLAHFEKMILQGPAS